MPLTRLISAVLASPSSGKSITIIRSCRSSPILRWWATAVLLYGCLTPLAGVAAENVSKAGETTAPRCAWPACAGVAADNVNKARETAKGAGSGQGSGNQSGGTAQGTGNEPGGTSSMGVIALLGSNGMRVEGKIVGSQLMLIGPNSNVAQKFAPAARGTYTQQDGTKLVVGDNGLIVERKHIGHPK